MPGGFYSAWTHAWTNAGTWPEIVTEPNNKPARERDGTQFNAALVLRGEGVIRRYWGRSRLLELDVAVVKSICVNYGITCVAVLRLKSRPEYTCLCVKNWNICKFEDCLECTTIAHCELQRETLNLRLYNSENLSVECATLL